MMELWLHIVAFFEILFTRNVMLEVAALALCLGLGWFVGTALRNRQHRNGIRTATALTRTYFLTYGMVVITPVLAVLGAVILARGLLYAMHYDVTALDAALRLTVAYIVVRIGVLLFAASLGNQSWMQHLETRLTLFIWLAIGLVVYFSYGQKHSRVQALAAGRTPEPR